MFDQIDTIGNSLIQHGPFNQRIYLMKLDQDDRFVITAKMDELAVEKNYTKLFVKVPLWAMNEFKKAGYIKEAHIPGFYNGKTGAYFMAKYLDENRRHPSDDVKAEIRSIIKTAQAKNPVDPLDDLSNALSLRELTADDAVKLTELYKIVFKSYPFPIHDPAYIKETMQDHIRYFGIFEGDRLLAASSSEMDKDAQNVEMTDFATHPDSRGRKFALYLLQHMESKMRNEDMLTFYTIARAMSPGMNITFAKQGYQYGGTLYNNTQISGGLESMNVWYKAAK